MIIDTALGDKFDSIITLQTNPARPGQLCLQFPDQNQVISLSCIGYSRGIPI